MKKWWHAFLPATYIHIPLAGALAFTVMWLALVTYAGAGVIAGEKAHLGTLFFDLFMLVNWIINLYRRFKRRRRNADWTTSPDDIYRACRDAGFSRSTAKAIVARAGERTYVSGQSAADARALASGRTSADSRFSRKGARTRTGIVLAFKEVIPDRIHGRVYSSAYRYVWTPGFNSANCPDNCKDIPAKGCACGFYAYCAEYANVSWTGGAFSGHVTLALELSGKIEVCELGYRAERAKILAMKLPNTCSATQMLKFCAQYPEAIVERAK